MEIPSQGLPITVPGSLTVTGTTFRGDQAPQVGGAIVIQGTPATFAGDTFANNSTTGFGGAIYYSGGLSGETLSIRGSVFTGNNTNSPAIGLGGAIYNGGTATVANSLFENNLAAGGASTMAAPSTAPSGRS